MSSSYTPSRTAARAQELFERRIAPLVADQHPFHFLAIDVVSGDFEVDADDMAADERLLARQPDAVIYLRRIGDECAYTLGGSSFRLLEPDDDE